MDDSPHRGLLADDARRVQTHFSTDPASAGRARRLLADACRQWGLAAHAQTAQTIVTELVENAIRHGGSAGSITVELRADALTMSVCDDGDGLPEVRHPGPEQIGGRGLLLVGALARDWGFRRVGAGKLVWADIAV